jgi:uncharacterized protein (DUF1499 family)
METILLVILAGLCIFALALNLKEEAQQQVTPLPAKNTIPLQEPYLSIHALDDTKLLKFVNDCKFKGDLYHQYGMMEAGRRGLL